MSTDERGRLRLSSRRARQEVRDIEQTKSEDETEKYSGQTNRSMNRQTDRK